ncbi:hypothetical protein PFISCL1PPCAC_13070 [Pristionchus fissidentatus]|uniref:Elongation of very long chain fatty acids protein n=1 Tax=Pristionchus fissidentatus TaxID=1538716 RepID=A0AAV5VTS9_9BILA|nr:hypothetical protein PFISCL1PPCAC_13070 [Pristionchus fissidentatus]
MYVMTIFALQEFMRGRPAFKLALPIKMWNLFVAVMSGVCAVILTPEYFDTMINKGYSASVCSSQDSFFRGNNGWAVFILAFARLPEYIDTLFIVLRKRPLLFIHWYHHALTIVISWYTFSQGVAGVRHGMYANAIIHTFMYSYYFFCAMRLFPPPFIARSITIIQILQFIWVFYSLAHMTVLRYVMGEPCEVDHVSMALSWIMDLSYLYLFVDFYVNKYKGESTTAKKID